MTKTKRWTVGSLFSGIGGFDLAFEQAGFRVACQVEIDSRAKGVLARHWPEVARYGDITQLDAGELEPVDVICGGSPCQNLSVAGSREGLAGPQSRLFFDFVRVCDAFPDAWVVWENVPGVFSTRRGEDFATVLREFTGFWPAVPKGGWGTEGVCIGPKRTVAWAVLDAQWFGVAQGRRRVFLVGHSRNRAGPYEILLEPESVRGDSPPRRDTEAVAPTLLASGAGTSRPAGIASEPDFLVTQALTGHFGRGGADDNDAQGGFLVIPVRGADVVYTLRSDPDGVGQGHNTNYIVATAVRRLTPRECERLQGFPDDWTRWDAAGRELSDTARYRMIGNAVAVPAVQWIAARLAGVLGNAALNDSCPP